MLNANSIAVQTMMKNHPGIYDGMPMYNGNPPTVESSIQPMPPSGSPVEFNQPYPSPKEMLTDQGQQAVYNPVGFSTTPVGTINPMQPDPNYVPPTLQDYQAMSSGRYNIQPPAVFDNPLTRPPQQGFYRGRDAYYPPVQAPAAINYPPTQPYGMYGNQYPPQQPMMNPYPPQQPYGGYNPYGQPQYCPPMPQIPQPQPQYYQPAPQPQQQTKQYKPLYYRAPNGDLIPPDLYEAGMYNTGNGGYDPRTRRYMPSTVDPQEERRKAREVQQNIQNAFNGYYNPYMVSNGGKAIDVADPNLAWPTGPVGQEGYDTAFTASVNGFTYEEQVKNDCSVYAMMSRAVSAYKGRSKEETEARAAAYQPKVVWDPELAAPKLRFKQTYGLHVQIVVGDEVVADIDPQHSSYNPPMEIYERCSQHAQYLFAKTEEFYAIRERNQANMYNNAIERRFDHCTLLEFFNVASGVIWSHAQMQQAAAQAPGMLSQVYNRAKYQSMLDESRRERTFEEDAHAVKFYGRYGVMPDGRPVAPGHDPAVAESFILDPATNTLEIRVPDYVLERMASEKAAIGKNSVRDLIETTRQGFIASIDEDSDS